MICMYALMIVDDLMTWQPEVCQDASQPLRAEQEMSCKWKCPLGPTPGRNVDYQNISRYCRSFDGL